VIYLSGHVHADLEGRSDTGFMLTATNAYRKADLTATAWAADNGCFSQGQAFRLDAFLSWLVEMHPYRETCLFAVAPDVVGFARDTWERSRYVLPVLRALGYRAALVGQDGMESMRVQWDAFDVLFIGGSTEWKLSEAAYSLMVQAKRRGKWVHMGRCNSLRRLRTAAMAGCDSADGTFLKFGPDKNLPRMERWLRELREQPMMLLTSSGE
jgi:hypothetical protein